MDQMVVYYAPSAEMAARLSRSPRRVTEDPSLEAMVVADTLSDLRYAREEGKYVASCLGTDAILGEDATCSEVLRRLEGVGIAHFACHGQVRIDSPSRSSLIMTDGMLTAAQLQESKLSSDVLVLSGCDTGFQPFDRTLDPSGIPSALLAAGTRCLIVGLWTVDDEATKELFVEFYSRLRTFWSNPDSGDEVSASVAGTLRSAQLALRSRRPERYFWAPFVTIGSW